MFAGEWRITSREPIFRWACVLVLLLTVTCLWNGQRFETQRNTQAQAEITRSIEKRQFAKETLRREAAGLVPVNPWGASEPNVADWNAARSSGPLAALSFGREDIEPFSANVSLFMVRADNLFRKHEFGSPLALAAGRFDVGFLVVLLLPLFVLALTYNVVAEERETGRLRLVAIQGPRLGARFGVRLALRLSPVLVSLSVIGVTAVFWNAPIDRLAIWLVAALLYLVFWGALGASIASLPWRQEALALTAAGVWLAVVVLLPASAVASANVIAPTPASFDLINTVREASNRANQRIDENLDGYVSEHPELQDAGANNEYWPAKLYASQRIVEDEIAPVIAEQLRRQERHNLWVDRLRFISPAAVLDQVLTDAAGTGRLRQQAYVEQAQLFLDRWGKTLSPMIFQRTRLGIDDIDRLPRFEFVEPDVPTARLLSPLAYLALLAAGMLGFAVARLRGLDRSFDGGRATQATHSPWM
ncbi:hypothetical protein A9995_13645 [Erythrobacter sp. QSSC1-22B]|nr:hypothetical protein A9995_13645 [Erythrobacter sp. QSSC1-22B]